MSVVLLVVGLLLTLAGLALWSVPLAMVVGGLLVAGAGLLLDFDNLTRRKGVAGRG